LLPKNIDAGIAIANCFVIDLVYLFDCTVSLPFFKNKRKKRRDQDGKTHIKLMDLFHKIESVKAF